MGDFQYMHKLYETWKLLDFFLKKYSWKVVGWKIYLINLKIKNQVIKVNHMFIYAKIHRMLYKTGFRMYKGAPLFGGRTIP